jgi:DNA-binding transcriptional MerR regulator
MAGALTREELELWYQVQRAYEAKDVVALETILARCDRVGANGRTLSELRELVMQANSKLATLRRSIDGLMKLPSWRFLSLDSAEIKTCLRNVRSELERAVRELSREAIVLQNELERIRTRTDRWMLRRKGAEAQLALGL